MTLKRARLVEFILLSVVVLVGNLWSSGLVERVLASSDAAFSTSTMGSEAPAGGISRVLFGSMVACRGKRVSLGGLVLQQMEMVNGW